MASQIFEFDSGRRLSWEGSGSGPTIMLIHGSPGAARNWRDVRAQLEGAYRVVAPDMLGYGGTDPRPPSAPPRTEHVAEYMEAFAATLGGPLLLAGHSYGGVVALRMALRGRVPLAGLALLEPVALGVLELLGDAEFAPAKTVFDAYVNSVLGGDHRAVQRMVDFWFGAGAFGRMPGPMQEFLVQAAPANALDVQATFAEAHTRDELQRLHLPVLVVHGSRSPKVSARIAQAIAGCVPHGETQELTGATHAMTATHAQAVADLIAAFAARCFAEK